MERNWVRRASLLAINCHYLLLWSFAFLGKVLPGHKAHVVEWLTSKIGESPLGTFPGMGGYYWLLVLAEGPAWILALGALVRREFWGHRSPTWLTIMLIWSMFPLLLVIPIYFIMNEPLGGIMWFVSAGVTFIVVQFVTQPPRQITAVSSQANLVTANISADSTT